MMRRKNQVEEISSSSSISSTSTSQYTPSISPSLTIKNVEDMFSRAYVEPSATLSGFLFANEEEEYSRSSSMVIDENPEEANEEEELEIIDDEDVEYLSSAVASDIEIGGDFGNLHDLLELSETTDVIFIIINYYYLS